MKKILYTLISIGGLAFASCDMDKYPYDKIPTDESLQTASDFNNFRNGFYAYLRSQYTGGYVLQPEIQADGLNAVIDYSNSYGAWYRWQFTAEDGGQWSTFYNLISNCNFIIEGAKQLLPTFTAEDQVITKRAVGDAYFMRALSYNQLALRFCPAYNASTAGGDWGVALVTKYAPTSNSSTYPARATLAETYAFIKSDLDSAAKYVVTPGEQNSGYVTVDAVTALKARVALQMRDYPSAIAFAKSLVDGGAYPLVSTAKAMTDMWTNDVSTETILQPIFKKGQLGSATGTSLVDKSASGTKIQPDFLPTKTVLDLYEQNDLRFGVYFTKGKMTFTTGDANLYYCTKYPGNPALYDKTTNFTNMPKILRIAEMYMILAEAYSESGDVENALAYLNTFRASRIAGYEPQVYGGAALTEEIRKERQREFYMEGYRLWDLKRYGAGMSGRVPQNGTFVYLNNGENSTAISKEAGDFRFVWPIPSHEINANPQMKQNNGY